MDDDSSQPTVRLGAIQGAGAEKDSAFVDSASDVEEQSGSDVATAVYQISEDALEVIAEPTTPDRTRELPTAAQRSADQTDMMSRDEIMQNAADDREELRHRKPTLRVESVVDTRPEQETPTIQDRPPAGRTREMKVIDESTAEIKTISESGIPVDSTDEFARHGVSSIDGADKIEYPARVTAEFQLTIPAELGAEIELEPGDLVMVKVQKVSD